MARKAKKQCTGQRTIIDAFAAAPRKQAAKQQQLLQSYQATTQESAGNSSSREPLSVSPQPPVQDVAPQLQSAVSSQTTRKPKPLPSHASALELESGAARRVTLHSPGRKDESESLEVESEDRMIRLDNQAIVTDDSVAKFEDPKAKPAPSSNGAPNKVIFQDDPTARLWAWTITNTFRTDKKKVTVQALNKLFQAHGYVCGVGTLLFSVHEVRCLPLEGLPRVLGTNPLYIVWDFHMAHSLIDAFPESIVCPNLVLSPEHIEFIKNAAEEVLKTKEPEDAEPDPQVTLQELWKATDDDSDFGSPRLKHRKIPMNRLPTREAANPSYEVPTVDSAAKETRSILPLGARSINKLHRSRSRKSSVKAPGTVKRVEPHAGGPKPTAPIEEARTSPVANEQSGVAPPRSSDNENVAGAATANKRTDHRPTAPKSDPPTQNDQSSSAPQTTSSVKPSGSSRGQNTVVVPIVGTGANKHVKALKPLAKIKKAQPASKTKDEPDLKRPLSEVQQEVVNPPDQPSTASNELGAPPRKHTANKGHETFYGFNAAFFSNDASSESRRNRKATTQPTQVAHDHEFSAGKHVGATTISKMLQLLSQREQPCVVNSDFISGSETIEQAVDVLVDIGSEETTRGYVQMIRWESRWSFIHFEPGKGAVTYYTNSQSTARPPFLVKFIDAVRHKLRPSLQEFQLKIISREVHVAAEDNGVYALIGVMHLIVRTTPPNHKQDVDLWRICLAILSSAKIPAGASAALRNASGNKPQSLSVIEARCSVLMRFLILLRLIVHQAFETLPKSNADADKSFHHQIQASRDSMTAPWSSAALPAREWTEQLGNLTPQNAKAVHLQHVVMVIEQELWPILNEQRSMAEGQ